MFKLILEKAEEPDIKLSTSAGSWKKQESSRETSISALLAMPKPLTVWIIKNCRKFFKRDGNIRSFYLSPDKYVCKTRNNSRIRHGTMDWFKIGKEVQQGFILLHCLFNLYTDYIVQNAGLDEPQAGIKVAGRNINNLRYEENTTLTAKSEEE